MVNYWAEICKLLPRDQKSVVLCTVTIYNISHKIIDTNSIPGKLSGNFGMVHFAEINQAPPPYSMLQYIDRVATPKLVPRNCLKYLQTTLKMGEGDWSQNLCEVLSEKINEK